MLTFILQNLGILIGILICILLVIFIISAIIDGSDSGLIVGAVLILVSVIVGAVVTIIFRDDINNWINGIFAWINDITGGLFLDTLNGKNTVGAILKIIADVFIFGFIIFAILQFFILKPKSNVDNESEEFDFDDEDFEEREEQEERNDCEPSEKK